MECSFISIIQVLPKTYPEPEYFNVGYLLLLHSSVLVTYHTGPKHSLHKAEAKKFEAEALADNNGQKPNSAQS